MIKVLVIIDLISLKEQLKQTGRKPNLISLCEFLANPFEERYGVARWVFTNIPPGKKEAFIKRYPQQEPRLFRVISREENSGEHIKRAVNTKFILTLVDFLGNAQIDLVVLASNDPGLAPLCEWLWKRGIRVEVAGLESHIFHELKVAAQGIIDLSTWFETCQVE
jgi:hypothetical protein